MDLTLARGCEDIRSALSSGDFFLVSFFSGGGWNAPEGGPKEGTRRHDLRDVRGGVRGQPLVEQEVEQRVHLRGRTAKAHRLTDAETSERARAQHSTSQHSAQRSAAECSAAKACTAARVPQRAPLRP